MRGAWPTVEVVVDPGSTVASRLHGKLEPALLTVPWLFAKLCELVRLGMDRHAGTYL